MGVMVKRMSWLALGLMLVVLKVQAVVTDVDRIVAVVDDDVVLASELDARIRSVSARLVAQGAPLPPADVMRERVLEQTVLDSIQLQMADRGGMKVSDDELNSTMARVAESNGLTLEDFEKALAKEGLTYLEARDQIRREMLVSRVQQRQVDGRVKVTEQEVNLFLASAAGRKQTAMEYLIGHILVAVSDPNSPSVVAAARAKADAILADLKAGADFRQTAVARSDGRNALEGGVIGWRKENEIPSLAIDIVPDLAVNEPSSVLESGSGFHIVTVLEKRGGVSKIVQQTTVRHILVKPTEIRTEDEAKEKIDVLYARLMEGADFAELAKQNSDDPVSASVGGVIEWVNPGDMVPEFERVMDAEAIGAVSKPFHSRFGWHILKVDARRKEDLGQLLQAAQARQILYRRKFDIELGNWLREIRDEAFVEIKDTK